MSRIIGNTKLKESNKENINYPNNYTEYKSSQNKRYGKIVSNQQQSLPLNTNVSGHLIANNLFVTKEKATNNNHRINNNNLNKAKDKDNKYITISDIIGEKCNINLDIIRLFYNNYEQSKTSKKKMGIVKSYGINTYQGIVRNYNEDRVSIIINMNRPKNYLKPWPKISFFGIYDGHGGEGCSEYLRDNLHKLICNNNEYFPDNVPEAIKLGFQKAEKDFINNYALNDKKEIIDRSGSCAVIILIIDNKAYVANVGDSRCLLSMENGKKFVEVTKDHKPNSPNEVKRIKKYGGNIYQSETVINNVNNPNVNGKILIGPYRVLPGRLSVSRTVGDVEAKLEKFGGNPNVIIPDPEIFFYDLNRNDIDFFILGCDGIYDQISSNEVLECAWMVLNEKENLIIKQCKDIHNQSGLIVDLIMKSALARKSFDNVTCLFVALKELGMNFNEQNEKTLKNNNIKENNNYLSPNISPVVPLSISTDMKNKNNFEKISMITRKSNTSLTGGNYGYINNERNNRNNNKFYLSNYRGSDNKKYPSSNTDFKIRNVKLNNTMTNASQFNSNYIIKENNNKSVNNRLSHNILDNNHIDYSRKNQSFSNINYPNNNGNSTYNNYRQIRKNNVNNYNNSFSHINASKKISEGNLLNKRNFGMEKIDEESAYINASNSHIFTPITKYNNDIKANENRNIRKNLSTTNNNIVSLSNINNTKKNNNQPYTTSHRYLTSTQNTKNPNYTSIRKNYLYLNQQYKNQNKLMNNNNNNNYNNTYSSITNQNINNLRNQKKSVSLNNAENDKKNYINNDIIRNNDKKDFSTRIERNSRQISIQKPISNSNIGLSNKNNNNQNIKSNNYYREIGKNYQNNTHNVNNNSKNKYSNYLLTEVNNSKKDYFNRGYKITSDDNNFENDRNKYNVQQYRRRWNNINNEINYKNSRTSKDLNRDLLRENEKNEDLNNNRRSKYYHRY